MLIEFWQAWAGGGFDFEMGSSLPWHVRLLRRRKQVESPSPWTGWTCMFLLPGPERGLTGLGPTKTYTVSVLISLKPRTQFPHPSSSGCSSCASLCLCSPMSSGQPRVNLRHLSLLGHKDLMWDKHLVAGTECSKALGLENTSLQKA